MHRPALISSPLRRETASAGTGIGMRRPAMAVTVAVAFGA